MKSLEDILEINIRPDSEAKLAPSPAMVLMYTILKIGFTLFCLTPMFYLVYCSTLDDPGPANWDVHLILAPVVFLYGGLFAFVGLLTSSYWIYTEIGKSKRWIIYISSVGLNGYYLVIYILSILKSS